MTLGFSSPDRLQKLRQELLKWTLYQVQIDKFNVMFWFEDAHCLLNVAYRFDFRSATDSLAYTYDVQAEGFRKFLNVEPILRQSIKAVDALDDRRLALVFETGDQLTIHDSPEMRSAWFYRYDSSGHNAGVIWDVDDLDPEDLA